MVLFSHSSRVVGAEQPKGKVMKLKKDLYEKDGKFVLSDGHPKEFAGQSVSLVARAGTEISDLQAKEYGLDKEVKAKALKENKAK
jgi:hypothetical protein